MGHTPVGNKRNIGKSLKFMLLKRFMKFVSSLLKTKRPFLKFLLSTVAADVRSVTGSNLRSIQLNTGVQVTPGQTTVSSIKKKVLHEVPVGEEWRVPLIHSLLEIRSGEFKLEFDEDDIADNEIVDDVLLHVCTS